MEHNSTKPRLLVTEDDYENQKFLDLFLKRAFEVEVCDSETSFYEKLKKQKFDIILMDISLRGPKNGLELTQEIRQMTEYKDIPIVCLSAHAFKRDKENALKAGVDIFLSKPVENKVLMDSLFEALDTKKKKQK